MNEREWYKTFGISIIYSPMSPFLPDKNTILKAFKNTFALLSMKKYKTVNFGKMVNLFTIVLSLYH